jgi:hypothetical protein
MLAAACAQRPRAPAFIDPSGYAPHRPEATLLYRLVEQHFPDFRELRAGEGRPLPKHVQEEFEVWSTGGGLPARAVRKLSCREARRVQLQEARVLSLVRWPAHGRDRGAAGR